MEEKDDENEVYFETERKPKEIEKGVENDEEEEVEEDHYQLDEDDSMYQTPDRKYFTKRFGREIDEE